MACFSSVVAFIFTVIRVLSQKKSIADSLSRSIYFLQWNKQRDDVNRDLANHGKSSVHSF